MELRGKAFLFDLDGVLVNSRAVVERTWHRWARRHRIDPDPFLQIAHGRRVRDTLHAVAPEFATDAEVAWLDNAELHDVEGLRVVPGAREFLSALPGGRWGIVTSCHRALALFRLAAAGVPVPEVLVVSEDVTRGKPAPDGYRLGAQRLGSDIADCLVFEDAPAGVAAGRAAGARVVGLTTTHAAQDLKGVEATIPDFSRIAVRSNGDALILMLP